MNLIYLLLLLLLIILMIEIKRKETLYIIEEEDKIRFLLTDNTYLIIDLNKNCKVSKLECIKTVLKNYSKELSNIVDTIIYVDHKKKDINSELLDIIKQ